MQGLKPHRLYSASNWLGSKTPSKYLSLSPSLPHSLPLYSLTPSIEAIWYLFLKYKGFRKADLRSPATIRVQENEKS